MIAEREQQPTSNALTDNAVMERMDRPFNPGLSRLRGMRGDGVDRTDSDSRRSARIVRVIRPGIVSLVAVGLYIANVSYNLNCFYVRGAGDDSGWFAWLVTNAHTWPIPNPPVFGGNYLLTHMSPIFFVSTILLQPLGNLPIAVRFCLFLSLWAPLLWLALFLLLDRFVPLSFGKRIAVSLLLTLNGLILSMLGFPHIEILIPALGLLALALWLRAETPAVWAGAGTVALLALMIREDAGLHLFLVALAMASVSALTGDWRATRRLLGLAAVSIAGGTVALLVQRLAVPGGGHQLGVVYLGHPALSQISAASLARRLAYWSTRRDYIFLPLAALICFGLSRLGDKRLLLGVAISIPWLVLSLIAVQEQAGDLWSYYCFPLVFMVVWPLLLSQASPLATPRMLSLQIGLGVLSTAAFAVVGLLPNSYVGDGGSHDKAPWAHVLPPSPASIRLTEAGLAHHSGWLFDYGAAALVFGSLQPGQFRAGLAFDEKEKRAARGFVRFIAEPRFLALPIAALTRAFPVCTRAEGTELQFCTREPESVDVPSRVTPSSLPGGAMRKLGPTDHVCNTEQWGRIGGCAQN